MSFPKRLRWLEVGWSKESNFIWVSHLEARPRHQGYFVLLSLTVNRKLDQKQNLGPYGIRVVQVINLLTR